MAPSKERGGVRVRNRMAGGLFLVRSYRTYLNFLII